MTIEEECPCSETTIDFSSTINSSETSDTSARATINTNNNCTCEPEEKLLASVPKQSLSLTSCQPPPANHQPQRGVEGALQPSTQFRPGMECLCHAYRVKPFALPDKYKQGNAERFNWKWPRREYARRKNKCYEVKFKRNHYRHYSKPYPDDDDNQGITRKKSLKTDKTDDEPTTHTSSKQGLEEITERIDIYYFDHGNSAYYRTTDSPPVLATEKCADKTDYAATRFWAEIFGTVHIGIAFVTAFILQFLRFVLFSIIRPLTVGILQLFADYFVKPFLSIFFNAVIQPILILLYNVATSVRDLCEPIAEALGFFLREVATVVRAFRIVEANRTMNPTTACT